MFVKNSKFPRILNSKFSGKLYEKSLKYNALSMVPNCLCSSLYNLSLILLKLA